MRVFRLFGWLVFGLILGGWSALSFAVTFNSSGGSSLISRSGGGSISGVNLPSTIASTPVGIQASAMNGLLSLKESGNWELLDPKGNVVKVPGTQTLSLSGAKLANLAGTAANVLKGSVQGAVMNYLLQEGIRFVIDHWEKDKFDNVYPETYWSMGSAIGTTSTFPNQWCSSAFSAGYTGEWSAPGVIYCNSPTGSHIGPYYPAVAYKCPNGSFVSKATTVCDQSVTSTFASEADLQNALDNRRKVIDAALKDYYDAVAAMDKNKLIEAAKDPSTKYSATGTPTQGAPASSTTTNPDGSTVVKTETPTYNIQSNGDTYNTNQVTITNITITNNTTNNNGNTTTTTTTEEKPQEDYSFTDSSLPPVPDLYTPKYPDGLAGVWNEKIATIKSSELFSFVNALSSGAPSSGSCPSWTLSLSGIGKLGSYTLQPPCIVWPFVRWALLITALFVSRRLVFGG